MNKKCIFVLLFVVFTIWGCNGSGGSAGGNVSSASSTANRSDSEGTTLDVAPQQWLNQIFPNDGSFSAIHKYFDYASTTNQYLSDFYGLYLLKGNLNHNNVALNFLSAQAKILFDSSSYLVVQTQDGIIFDFYFNRNLILNGNVIETRFNYMRPEVNNIDNLISALQSFRNTLDRLRLTDQYLVANYNYDYEKLITDKLQLQQPTTNVERVDDGIKFSNTANAILLVPDPVHGNIDRYNQLFSAMQTSKFDWLGIEMFDQKYQKDIDTFLSADINSQEYQNAYNIIINNAIWKGKFPDEDPNHPENNRYFLLLKFCRENNIKVYALDKQGDPLYDLWGHGETPVGGDVRSLLWTFNMPNMREQGSTLTRGIVFGGSAHMSNEFNVNVQDFYLNTNPTVKYFKLN
ncbi:MAG TPA: hypothetical protein VKR58_12610 [Aquella sp.]|nr:hypothetical protein [Aquella sp.]